MKKISLEAIAVYVAICRNMKYFNSTTSTCGNSYLASSTFLSKDKIPELLNELKEAGYIDYKQDKRSRFIQLTNQKVFDFGTI